MTPTQWWLCLAVQVGILGTLLGLLVRRRASSLSMFTAHLLTVLACEGAILASPEDFWHYWFFLGKETAYAALRVGLAVELAFVVFRQFPGALHTSKRVIALALGLSALYIGSAPRHASGPLTEWHSQVGAATMVLLLGTAFLVEWYHLPVSRLHRAVLMGFGVYVSVFVFAVNALSHSAYGLSSLLGKLDAVAYLGVVLWWMRAAWAKDGEDTVEPAVLRRLVA